MKRSFWGKKIASLLSLVLAMSMMLTGISVADDEQKAKDGELTGKSAMEITTMMGIGWNLGNTFDATGGTIGDVYSQESSWGNPRVTEELIDAVHKAGFDTIRIPITWDKQAAKFNDHIINEDFMNRIQEVVDYAYSRGMFVIINVHHESWINTGKLIQNKDSIAYRLSRIWEQIAERFADYDQHLIFEGMNEPRLASTSLEWTGKPEAYEVINYLDQVFVSTVRSNSKGHNAERCLMIPGYAASNSSAIMDSINLPTWDGKVAKNLMISVHSYAPYNFCLSDSQMDFDPTNPADTGAIDQMYVSLKDMFLDQGIPVVLGETSATSKNNTEARERWAKYAGMKTAQYGVPMVIWDNGSDTNKGGESHAYINRKTCEWNYPTVVQAAIDGIKSVTWGEALTGGSNPGEGSADGTVIWADENGLKVDKTWNADAFAIPAKSSYFADGREIAVTYSGDGNIQMVMDSEVKQAWWIPVPPTRVEDKDGKRVAYFSYDAMMTELKKFNVEGSEVRRMCFIVETPGLTFEKVVATGNFVSVIYKVNGQQYATGAELPADPEVEGMKFEGWYTTKDYQPGTEYKGAEGLTSDVVVYAKLALESLPRDPLAPPATPTPEPTPEAEPSNPEDNNQPTITPQPDADASGFTINIYTLMVAAAVVVVAIVVVIIVVASKKKK